MLAADGNLVIYGASGALWDSGTPDDQQEGNDGGQLLTLSSNGALEITNRAGNVIWLGQSPRSRSVNATASGLDSAEQKMGSAMNRAGNIFTLHRSETLFIHSRISHLGAEKEVHVYMGAIFPDGNTIAFITSLEPLAFASGTLDDPTSYWPLIENKQLTSQVLEYTPNTVQYTFTGAEDKGAYQFFSILAKPDVFDDGIIHLDDIISLDLDWFNFQ